MTLITDITGVVTEVVVTKDVYIYFKLSNQPTTHPSCNPEYFTISSSTTDERRRLLLARIMLSKASGQPMSVGYDGTDSCSGGYLKIYRVC